MLSLSWRTFVCVCVCWLQFAAKAAQSSIDTLQMERILGNMQNASDPCDNFWHYACGNWQHTKHGSAEDNFEIIEQAYTPKLIELLDKQQQRSTGEQLEAPQLLGKLRVYFTACRNAQTTEQTLQGYLHAMPAALNWIHALLAGFETAHNVDWLLATAQLRKYGLNGVFFDESVDVAYNDSLRIAAQLKMPENSNNFQRAADVLTFMLSFGGNVHVTSEHAQLAGQVFQLERQLQALNAKHSAAETIEVALSLADLKLKIPEIDWQTYFDTLLATVVPPHLRVEVSDIGYLRELGALLQRQPERVAKMYLLTRLAAFLHEIKPQFNDANCIAHMGVTLSLGMSYIYERQLYRTRRQDTQKLQQIFSQLKATFLGYLRANKLMLQQKQLQYLQRKLTEMHIKIGNLPTEADVDWYDRHYGDTNLTDMNFYANHLEMLRFRTSQQHAQLLQHAGQLDLNTFYINDDIQQLRDAPYFVHQRNLLIVPMTFMQLPFFHAAQHVVFQYSLLGWILAHELNHGFELEGIIFDAYGNESPTGFGIRSQSRFQAAHDCLKHTPTTALKERVADVNGFQLAYDALFQQHMPVDSTLAEGAFNQRQLFYLNFAQFFCGNLPTAVAHDRDDQRVNEVVGNMPEFLLDFQCSASWTRTCEMWRPPTF